MLTRLSLHGMDNLDFERLASRNEQFDSPLETGE